MKNENIHCIPYQNHEGYYQDSFDSPETSKATKGVFKYWKLSSPSNYINK